jgi:hypothetical protein
MAASSQLGHSRQNDSTEEAGEDSARISGERPAQGQYAPLPLGSEAFLCPLPPPPDPEEQRGRRFLPWMILGTCVLAGSAAFAVVLAMRSNALHAPEAQPLPRPQVERASAPAPTTAPAPAVAPAAAAATIEVVTEEQAAPAVAAPRTHEPAPPVASPPAAQTIAPARAAPRAHAARRSPPLPQQLDRAQVVAALASVRPAVVACFGATRGTATARITVLGRTGQITTAQISGQGGAIGSCIAREVRRARFPRFADASLVISYPFAR